jgi:hypothetical protein
VFILFSGLSGCSSTHKFEVSEEVVQAIREDQEFATFWEDYHLQVKHDSVWKRQIRKAKAEAEAIATAKERSRIEAEAKAKVEEEARIVAAAETARIQAEKDAISKVKASNHEEMPPSPPPSVEVQSPPPTEQTSPKTNRDQTSSIGQGVDLNGNGWNDDFDRMVEEGKKTDERGGGDGYWN